MRAVCLSLLVAAACAMPAHAGDRGCGCEPVCSSCCAPTCCKKPGFFARLKSKMQCKKAAKCCQPSCCAQPTCGCDSGCSSGCSSCQPTCGCDGGCSSCQPTCGCDGGMVSGGASVGPAAPVVDAAPYDSPIVSEPMPVEPSPAAVPVNEPTPAPMPAAEPAPAAPPAPPAAEPAPAAEADAPAEPASAPAFDFDEFEDSTARGPALIQAAHSNGSVKVRTAKYRR